MSLLLSSRLLARGWIDGSLIRPTTHSCKDVLGSVISCLVWRSNTSASEFVVLMSASKQVESVPNHVPARRSTTCHREGLIHWRRQEMFLDCED